MRRSDIKQIRRRLSCAALRVWEAYTDAEKNINRVFVATQKFEVAAATDAVKEFDFAALLAELRAEAQTLIELLTWYKAGHEQLNAMIAVAEARAKELK